MELNDIEFWLFSRKVLPLSTHIRESQTEFDKKCEKICLLTLKGRIDGVDADCFDVVSPVQVNPDGVVRLGTPHRHSAHTPHPDLVQGRPLPIQGPAHIQVQNRAQISWKATKI